MTKKNTFLILTLVILGGIYICFFTSWFKPKTIKIFYTMRPMERFQARSGFPYILFVMGGKFRLTEVKVVSQVAYQKNPNASPIWHLVSDSNSIPISEFIYAQHIHGMKQAVAGAPKDLETNQIYSLFVTAGSAKGTVNFKVR